MGLMCKLLGEIIETKEVILMDKKSNNTTLVAIVAIIAIVSMIFLVNVRQTKVMNVNSKAQNIGGEATHYSKSVDSNADGIIRNTLCSCMGGSLTFECPGPCSQCCGKGRDATSSLIA